MHTLRVYYRPDNYPDWVLWKEFIQKFDNFGRPSALNANGVPTAQPGFAPRVSFGKPSNECDPHTGRRLRRGFNFQVKFSGTGHVVFDKFRLHAQRLVERATATPVKTNEQ